MFRFVIKALQHPTKGYKHLGGMCLHIISEYIPQVLVFIAMFL